PWFHTDDRCQSISHTLNVARPTASRSVRVLQPSPGDSGPERLGKRATIPTALSFQRLDLIHDIDDARIVIQLHLTFRGYAVPVIITPGHNFKQRTDQTFPRPGTFGDMPLLDPQYRFR